MPARPSSSSDSDRWAMVAATPSCASTSIKYAPPAQPRRAFVRMEPEAGERFEVDWGHFGALNYEGDQRKLYAFALVDGHSRMSYLEFTHSQCFETFVRCHVHAFTAFNGVSREVFYDNLKC